MRPRLLFALALAFVATARAASPLAGQLSAVKTIDDYDRLVTSSTDAAAKRALTEARAAAAAALEQRPHAQAVAQLVEGAKGKEERVNSTPDALKAAAGGEVALFETLRSVDLAVPGAGPHDKRESDPYDAAFFEHLGHLTSLESLNVISTKANDEWIAPLGHLTHLKTLRFTNNGKLTDAGLESLAGLQELEQFSYVGTAMTGRGFAKWQKSPKLERTSFRGSSIDDEGLALLCDRLFNLQSISLAHAKFTTAGMAALAGLKQLKGLELGSVNASAAGLKSIAALPLEYLQLGEGFGGPEAVDIIAGMPTLRRLTLIHTEGLTDADWRKVQAMPLEQLELGDLRITDDQLTQMPGLARLKQLRVLRKEKFTPEAQAKIKAAYPKVEIKFE